MAAPSGTCCPAMAAIAPPPAAISVVMKLTPAIVHAAAAARNFAESPVGQIIPMYGATQLQPAGALLPVPTADGGQAPTVNGPVTGGVGRLLARPAISDIASASAELCADIRTPSPMLHSPLRVLVIASIILAAAPS
ncbi:hypothetical protein [Mycobacterium arosiense]|uniref:hypothetical protein n=1 Tax=Mycobacterium arosiense TaxID=425468 RepID=UPI001FE42464|nr:hypothetical protein [Mycobacterium arosiense]